MSQTEKNAKYYGHINQVLRLDSTKPEFKEEWKKFSLEDVDRFLSAVREGFVLEKYNEFQKGMYLTTLSKDGQQIEIQTAHSWPLMLTLENSEKNKTELIAFLENLKTTIGHKHKELPEHLL